MLPRLPNPTLSSSDRDSSPVTPAPAPAHRRVRVRPFVRPRPSVTRRILITFSGPINQFFKAPMRTRTHRSLPTELIHRSILDPPNYGVDRPVVCLASLHGGVGWIYSCARFSVTITHATHQYGITEPLSDDTASPCPSCLIPTPSSTSGEKSCRVIRRGLFLCF